MARKVRNGPCFALFYEWNYGLDAFGYWQRGQLTYGPLPRVAFGDGTEAIEWLCGVFARYAIADSYHATKITFAYVGLNGTFLFYRAATWYRCSTPPEVVLLLGLVPSTLQWSSILGKDPSHPRSRWTLCLRCSAPLAGEVAEDLWAGSRLESPSRP